MKIVSPPPYKNNPFSLTALILVSTIGVTIAPNSAQAINLIGNLSSGNPLGGNGTDVGIGPMGIDRVKAVSFSLSSDSDYTLDNVVLALSGYTNSNLPSVTIRNSTGGTTPGSTILGTLTNPSANDGSAAQFTFTPNSSFTLQANTAYWLYVDHTAVSNGNFFRWLALNPNTPPSGLANFGDYAFSNNGGSSFVSSGIFNGFQINATAVAQPVPEPVTILGTLMAGALGVAFKPKSR